MQPATFDSLPNEVLIDIIVRVPFSRGNLQALLFINRRISALMTHRNRKLLEYIAKVQFPFALWAVVPWRKFHYTMSASTVQQLDELRWKTYQIPFRVGMLQEIRDSMIEKGWPLGSAMSAQGWRANLTIGLYALNFPSELRYKWHASFRAVEQPEMKRCHATVFNGLPRYAILAIRHSTCIIAEAMRFLKESFIGKSVEDEQRIAAADHHAEATIQEFVEYWTFNEVLRFLEDVWDSRNRKGQENWECKEWEVLSGRVESFRDDRNPQYPIHATIRTCLDARIRDILHDWDNFVIQDPDAIAALQPEGEQPGLGAVRALVESFLEE